MHLLLFNLYGQGHHGEYVRLLAERWVAEGYAGRLTLVVSPRLLEWTPGLADLAAQHARVRLVVEPDAAGLEDGGGLGQAALAHRRLLRRHVAAERPDHVLLLYFDHVQPALALDLRFDYPVRLSGIYFRPSFHYAHLAGRRPGFKERLNGLRKRLLLAAALRNPHVDTLFSLDPFVLPDLGQIAPRVHAVHLPEAFDAPAATRPASEVRSELGVVEGRTMLLLFGALAARKGLYETLEALLHLDPSEARNLCLVLAGRLMEDDPSRFNQLVRRVTEETQVQLLLHTQRIPPEAVQDYFHAADAVLLPYQHHVGSSGVLIRAAHAGVPVVGPDYGMLAALIRRHRLGLAVDTTRPEVLAGAFRTLTDGAVSAHDPEAMRCFAGANTAETFATTIFRNLHLSALDLV